MEGLSPEQIVGFSVAGGVVLGFILAKIFSPNYKLEISKLEDELSEIELKHGEFVKSLEYNISETNKELQKKTQELYIKTSEADDLKDDVAELKSQNLELSLGHLAYIKSYTKHLLKDKEAAYSFILHLDGSNDITDAKKVSILRTLTDDTSIITNGNQQDFDSLIGISDQNKKVPVVEEVNVQDSISNAEQSEVEVESTIQDESVVDEANVENESTVEKSDDEKLDSTDDQKEVTTSIPVDTSEEKVIAEEGQNSDVKQKVWYPCSEK